MSDVAIRIFESVKGDPATIQKLAAAVAHGDVAGVQQILAARGVNVDDAAVAQVVGAASAGGAGANMTLTFTFT